MGKPNPELTKKIAELAPQGHSVREIADILGVHYDRVYHNMKYHGIKIGVVHRWEQKRLFWTEERVREVDRLKDSGVSYKKIAHMMGTSYDSVRQIYNRNGYYSKYKK